MKNILMNFAVLFNSVDVCGCFGKKTSLIADALDSQRQLLKNSSI